MFSEGRAVCAAPGTRITKEGRADIPPGKGEEPEIQNLVRVRFKLESRSFVSSLPTFSDMSHVTWGDLVNPQMTNPTTLVIISQMVTHFKQ